MPLRSQIGKAIEALLSYQNEDGGIPATYPGHASGCWTTSDVLENLLVAGVSTQYGVSKIRELVNFLLNTQIGSEYFPDDLFQEHVNPDIGGWPLYRGAHASTMATGHAVASLQLAYRFFDEDTFNQKIGLAIKYGFRWLNNMQNPDGGWGPEPASEQDGAQSKVVACFYALLAYKYRGNTYKDSRTVRKAVDFLLENRNRDGSWGFAKGWAGDPCNTARAVTCLLRTQYASPQSKIVRKALDYIINNQLPGGLWDLDTEKFHVEDAPAELVYNNNTVCDVLVAFCEAEYYEKETFRTLKWLLSTQEENGLWYLSSPVRTVQTINTWSTAEWVCAVDIASRKYLGYLTEIYKPQSNLKSRLLIVAGVFILVVNSLYTYRVHLGAWWQNLPDWIKTFMVSGIILAAIMNFFSDMLSEYLKRWYSKLLEFILSNAQRHNKQ